MQREPGNEIELQSNVSTPGPELSFMFKYPTVGIDILSNPRPLPAGKYNNSIRIARLSQEDNYDIIDEWFNKNKNIYTYSNARSYHSIEWGACQLLKNTDMSF